MKRKDPRLVRAGDIRQRGREQRPPTRDRRPPPRPLRKDLPRPEPPPFPTFLLGGIGFTVMLMASAYLHYFLGIPHIPSLLFYLSLAVLGFTIFYTIDFNVRYRSDHGSRCKISTIIVTVIMVVGGVVGGHIFMTKEPYHDWSYKVELVCTLGCEADLPVPMMDKDTAFFSERNLRTEGSGDVNIVTLRYEGKDILALNVRWSGNLTIKVSDHRDYRTMDMDRYGLWNSTYQEFVIVGRSIPLGRNATMKMDFHHVKVTHEYKYDEWGIHGEIAMGVNMYRPDRV